jgi:hypothetical protein
MSRNNIVATFARNLNNAANAAKSPITNLASNISSAIVSNTNSLNSLNTNAAGGIHYYIWIIALVVGISIIYLMKRYFIDENPGMFESWFAMFRNEQRRGIIPDVPSPPITPPSPPAPVHPDTESWCFVGEDLTGRYCVKVPSSSSCESSRRYTSRNDCEMIPAQHLPAGIITKQGTSMLPLAA